MEHDNDVFFQKLDNLRIDVMKSFLREYAINYDNWDSVKNVLSALEELIHHALEYEFKGELVWEQEYVAHQYLKGITVDECIKIFI